MLVKGRLRQDELEGILRETLTRWLNGHRRISVDELKGLALALDATSDYLIGLGDNYRDSYELAAAKMSFAYFDRSLGVDPELKERCRRVFEDDDVLMSEGAPRTADDWKTVARMIDRSTPPKPVQIDEARRA